jgi:hypothetical protein
MRARCPPVSLPGVSVGTPTAQHIQCCEYYLLGLRKQRTVMRPFELAAMRVLLPELRRGLDPQLAGSMEKVQSRYGLLPFGSNLVAVLSRRRHLYLLGAGKTRARQDVV